MEGVEPLELLVEVEEFGVAFVQSPHTPRYAYLYVIHDMVTVQVGRRNVEIDNLREILQTNFVRLRALERST